MTSIDSALSAVLTVRLTTYLPDAASVEAALNMAAADEVSTPTEDSSKVPE